jgi:hypothetical protein
MSRPCYLPEVISPRNIAYESSLCNVPCDEVFQSDADCVARIVYEGMCGADSVYRPYSSEIFINISLMYDNVICQKATRTARCRSMPKRVILRDIFYCFLCLTSPAIY